MPTKDRHKEEAAKEARTELATKLYLESMRQPVKVKAPKIPTQEELDEHNLTHIPFQSWCEACLATRSKEDARKSEVASHGKPVIQFDFGYTYTDPNGETDEEMTTKISNFKDHPKDQFGTMRDKGGVSIANLGKRFCQSEDDR